LGVTLYSVEILIEVDAPTAEDAASLALLEARTSTDPFRVDVFSDDAPSGRYWRQIVVEPASSEREV
jgi:hypothetical protein